MNATVINVSPQQTVFTNEEKASSFLQKSSWIMQVTRSLDTTGTGTVLELSYELFMRADQLQKQLEQGLTRHCKLRITDEKKRDHWCLLWVSKNLPPMAAIMVLFNHIKSDISCLDVNQCLLSCSKSFLKATSGRYSGFDGCYLYYDLNNEEWIRSGKTIGRPFREREAEHKKASLLKSAVSQKTKFYNAYPSKDVLLPDESAKKGEYENLAMLVGVTYSTLFKGNLIRDIAQGGIFHFDQEVVEKISKVNFREQGVAMARVQHKQMHMLGYLWELAYDLCIAPASNISVNPGFETLLLTSK